MLGEPAVPVAANVNGEPVRDPLDAVSVLAPAVVPSVQFTEAMPLEFVVEDAADVEPPPLATVQFTVTPDTGLL